MRRRGSLILPWAQIPNLGVHILAIMRQTAACCR